MDINQIENNIDALLSSYTEDSFIYGLLSAYGLPNAAITRLKNGEYNLAKEDGQILWKKKVCFRKEKSQDLHSVIDQLKKTPAISKQHPRFIIVTDFKTLLALDTENSDTLDIPFKDLSRRFDFFLPWAGMEKSQLQRESLADIKAAERMGRLYDLILEENPIENEDQRHSLNVFFTRLLFCYFAEDTGIFPSGIFVNGVASHTAEDGSDLQVYFSKLFDVLNTEDRKKCPAYLVDYPYVNGGLFATESPAPKFNARSRKILIECGSLNWKAINPDIFGSMMQAVVHSEERSGKGMHYTSVVNIMKVIEPLFLNDLREELEKAGDNKQKLEKLLERIYRLRIFDPACGSGNFLIIAYKELCKLEIEIFKRLNPHGQMSFKFQNKLKINQFYGIEIDDFAHETAKLSLWLAEHQMNLAFREVFGNARPTLPLQDGGNIICGNATRLAWEVVCPIAQENEIFILGNPPYKGSKIQSKEQKADLAVALESSVKGFRDLDYIACWFVKAAEYIRNRPYKFAFVTTNSISQGTQVSALWPSILTRGLEIEFVHSEFKWTNNARGNAGVICVIIGIRNVQKAPKIIFTEGLSRNVSNINAYLTEGANIIVERKSQPQSGFPKMCFGNAPYDGGHLILDQQAKDALVEDFPSSEKFLKKLIGTKEYLSGTFRWCIWIENQDLPQIDIEPILNRIHLVKEFRLKSTDQGTREMASRPHQFREMKLAKTSTLLIPRVSSERREYIPLGLLSSEYVISDAQVIYDAPLYLFALLASKMHMVWVHAVAGRLKSDIRYSSALCYNTFHFPHLNEQQKVLIEDLALRILDIREKHSESTMAQLYDPEDMPAELLLAHRDLDLAVEQVYRERQFKSDDERLAYLLTAYENATSGKYEERLQQCLI